MSLFGAYKWGFYHYLPTGMILQVAPCFFSNRRNSKALKVFDREDVRKGGPYCHTPLKCPFWDGGQKKSPISHVELWPPTLHDFQQRGGFKDFCSFHGFHPEKLGNDPMWPSYLSIFWLIRQLVTWLLVMPEICRKFHEGISNDQSDNVTLTSEIMCFPPRVKHYIEYRTWHVDLPELFCWYVYIFSVLAAVRRAVFSQFEYIQTPEKIQLGDYPFFVGMGWIVIYSYSFRKICSSRNSAMSLCSRFAQNLVGLSMNFPQSSLSFLVIFRRLSEKPSSFPVPLRTPLGSL